MVYDKCKIVFFWSNIIGYLRFFSTIVFIVLWESHIKTACTFYFISCFLDFFDGHVARMMNQVSQFGAQLDVIIDIFTRGSCWVFISPRFFFVPCLEWVVFSVISTNGPFWKDKFQHAPNIIQQTMRNNFRSLTGLFAICGLDGLPIFLFLFSHGLFDLNFLTLPLLAFLVAGRILSAITEIYIIINHVWFLLDQP